jgi:hypothetical protein
MQINSNDIGNTEIQIFPYWYSESILLELTEMMILLTRNYLPTAENRFSHN